MFTFVGAAAHRRGAPGWPGKYVTVTVTRNVSRTRIPWCLGAVPQTGPRKLRKWRFVSSSHSPC